MVVVVSATVTAPVLARLSWVGRADSQAVALNDPASTARREGAEGVVAALALAALAVAGARLAGADAAIALASRELVAVVELMAVIAIGTGSQVGSGAALARSIPTVKRAPSTPHKGGIDRWGPAFNPLSG